MALMDCVGSRAQVALLQAVEEAVKDSDEGRLRSLLADGGVSIKQLQYRSILHRAVWLGHTACVRLLVDHGVRPDEPHRKNGCTPLHLAHFCTIDDTNPASTIRTLIEAGANINNPGSSKCGKFPIDHAIQHQRMDSVQALLDSGSLVTIQSVHIAIDVANPRILELLLINGGACGRRLDTTLFWGQPLHWALNTPLKCPRECYKQMFRLLVQATVCAPLSLYQDTSNSDKSIGARVPTSVLTAVELELRVIAREHFDVALYLYAYLLRNGFKPTESCRRFMNARGGLLIEWADEYFKNPTSLRDLAMRTVRSYLYTNGNAMYGLAQLHLPARLQNIILLLNPM